ncbi:hypothetical protein H0H81_007047 [Sphagnurus paluster]|uniref:GED domain-containing protein n=1 Tax=Sphagnurus paluster TaxID=117069 RepID=A0A9P7GM97_9AGAR|nr:hypothetical protein H0H81_007047 [Sphagnurus paluster]
MPSLTSYISKRLKTVLNIAPYISKIPFVTMSSESTEFSTDDSCSDVMENNQGIGLSNPALSQSSRQMLDLVNRLHTTGVQVDIDLPQIAVIGSQSAGKSSLIESISGITLPRAAGTCTRCPTECRLSRSSGIWQCAVSLRIFVDGKMRTEKFGDVITDRSQVEDRIKRAQWAILNPSVRSAKGVRHFLTGNDHGSALELSFSNDFVSLQISGPDVADLSFCDLPGLIAGVGMTGNIGDIDLVKNLVASYIKRPSCIILLTVACESVLTKPDRIPTGEEPNWISLIRNEKEPLENGWYCVKQPSSAQINAGITWAGARKSETEFFASTASWSELDSIYHKYLGTGNLVERLSTILSDLISKRLPKIQDEIEKSILATREALSRLPKAPSDDPRNEIATLLHSFVRDLAKHVEGVPENGLLQLIRPAQETFRHDVRITAPQFQPFEKRYGNKKSLGKAQFLSTEENPDEFQFDPADDSHDSEGDTSLVVTGKKIYIDEVLERANRARTRELPGNYPFVVQDTFIKAIIKKWHSPAQTLCRTVFHILADHVRRLVHQHFGSFGQGQLEQRVKVLLTDHLNKCMKRTEERLEWLISIEDRPFSLNTHYLADYKEKFLAHYRFAREKDRSPQLMNAITDFTPAPVQYLGRGSTPPVPSGIAKILAGLAEIGFNGVTPEKLSKLIEPDGMEPALVIMAEVRAYFQVAYKRFADNVPLAIDHELVYGIERGVLQVLNGGLGINSIEGHRICKDLAQENPTIAGRREELTKKLERMHAASRQLLQIGF